jgi:hypothetical protein
MEPKTEEQPAPQSTALARLDAQELIKIALEQNADIDKLERLFGLAKEIRAEQARSAWYAAMAEFQARCPAPKKDRTASMGTFTFKYATLQEWMRAILPTMGDCGLAVSFETSQGPASVSARCVISHALGHAERSGTIEMPIPKPLPDGKGANEMQRVGISLTYAMRNALRSVIGLAPEDGEDEVAGTGSTVRQPARSAPPAQPAARSEAPAQAEGEVRSWTGRIKSVTTRSGVKKATEEGKKDTPWTIYNLVADLGLEFGTFSESHAKFAKEAGTSRVKIEYRVNGSRLSVVSIDAAHE